MYGNACVFAAAFVFGWISLFSCIAIAILLHKNKWKQCMRIVQQANERALNLTKHNISFIELAFSSTRMHIHNNGNTHVICLNLNAYKKNGTTINSGTTFRN